MRLAASPIIALAAAAALGACAKVNDLEQSSGTGGSCAACHGFPPATITRTGENHPSNTSCGTCHADTVDANGDIIAGGAHMNGQIDATGGHDVPFVAQHTAYALADIASCKSCHGPDYAGSGDAPSCTACHQSPTGADFAGDWRTNCTFCHGGGDAGRDPSWAGSLAEAAPPQSVAGPDLEPDQTSTNAHVGAHQRHLVAGTYSAPLSCDTCHAVPAQTFPESLEHVDGAATIQLSALAQQGVTTPGYAGGSCAVYCHGASSLLGGGTNPTPAWTSTGAVGCGSCHTLSPTSGGDYGHTFHVGDQGVACEKCHEGYSISGDTADLATHVNGTFEARITAGAYTRSATIGPHATPTWPSGGCTATCHTSIPPF